MEAIDMLRIQNRLIDSFAKSKELTLLKKFNDELIENIKFEYNHPLVFSIEPVMLLVKMGFSYSGHSTGKSYSSYDIYDKNNIKFCRLFHGEGETIIFMYNKKSGDYRDRESIEIPNEAHLTESYLMELLETAKRQ